MMNDIENLLTLAKLQKESDEIIKHLVELENALFQAKDFYALGLARCLETELSSVKSSLSKATIYNIQLNNLLKEKYNE